MGQTWIINGAKVCGFRRSKVYLYVGESRLLRAGSSMERSFEAAEGALYELDEDNKGYREINLEYLQKLRQARRTDRSDKALLNTTKSDPRASSARPQSHKINHALHQHRKRHLRPRQT